MLFLGLWGGNLNFKECLHRSLFFDSVTEAFDLDYPIENDNGIIRILGSCNGLILLADYSESLLLWNPTTRRHKNLPDFRPTCKKYSAIYGIGYDELHDDYKVVGLSCDYCGSDGVEVKVYSLKSESWTSVDYFEEIFNTSDNYSKMKLTGSGLFANGKLHWDTIISGPNISLRTGRNIISFDLANEKWEKVEKPSYGEGDIFVKKVGSALCAFSLYEGPHLCAWVMKEYRVKESWMKMFTIRYPDVPLFCSPFFTSNKSQILVTFGSTFMIYNSKDDSFRYPDIINFGGYHEAEIYIESLVCPFSIEGTENA